MKYKLNQQYWKKMIWNWIDNPRDHSFLDTAGLLCSDRFSDAAAKHACRSARPTLSFCCVMERLFVISAGSSSRLEIEEAGRCSPYGWHTCGSPPWGVYYESWWLWDLNTIQGKFHKVFNDAANQKNIELVSILKLEWVDSVRFNTWRTVA